MTEFEFKYYYYHIITLLTIPVILLAFITPNSLYGTIFTLYIVMFYTGAIGGLVGYHIEAKRLKQTDSDWVPRRYHYTIIHIVLTPFVASSIYLYQRHKYLTHTRNNTGLTKNE